MCEFKVYVAGSTPEEKELVAKEIIIARIRDRRVVLLTMMGESVFVDSVTIREVNTMKQELILQKVCFS